MKCSSNRGGIRRSSRTALVSAIVVALACGAMGTASAQSTGNYALDSTNPQWAQSLQLQNFLHSVNNAQSLYGDLTAQATGADSIFITADGSGSPYTANSNTVSVLAVGNNATGTGDSANPNDNAGNSIDLGLLAADGAGNGGLGIYSGQLSDGNTVQASASDVSIATDLTNHDTGAVTESGNAISVATRVNDASSTISGALPTTAFSGTSTGSAEGQAANVPVDTFSLDSQGDIVIGNAQVNADSTATTTVSGDAIRVTDDTDGAVSADFASNGNAIGASFTGNRSANRFDALSGGAVSYNGSVAVANTQASSTAGGSVSISGGGISTLVTGTHTFTGTVSQSDNSLTADVQANAAGNSLVFGDGISVFGDGSPSGLDLEEANNYDPTTTADASTRGDLALQNLQSYTTTSFAGLLGSNIGTSGITAQVNAVGSADAAVTVDGNQARSTVGANAADNTLSAQGAAFDAGVAVGNMQESLSNSIMSASVGNVQIQASMAAADRTSQGAVTVSGNTLAAGAQVNSATTSVSLSGTQFGSGTGTAFAEVGYDGAAEGNYLSSPDAGISVGNQQTNLGSDGFGSVSSQVSGSGISAIYSDSIVGGSGVVEDNAIVADAGGDTATTSLQLAGTHAATSAFLGNNQDSETNISASLNPGLTGIEVTNGNVSDATLSVGGNRMAGSVTGNQASNALTTDFTNATLGDGGGAPWFDPAIEIDVDSDFSDTRAALALSSVQYADGNLSATTANSQTRALVDAGNVSATPITVQSNSASASAIGNSVGNTLAPGVGNLSTDGGSAAQVAALGNFQYEGSDIIHADVDTGFFATGQIFTQVAGSLGDSPVTVSSNSVSAFGAGNVAGNGMAVSGTDYVPAAVGGINGYLHVDFVYGEVFAAFGEQNMQLDDGGERRASIEFASMGTMVGGNIDGSPLTVDGNQASADARGDYASNTLSLSGFSTLTTTAGLLNEQGTGYDDFTDVSSAVNGTHIVAQSLGGDLTDSAVTLSGNVLSAKAISNTALDSLAVQAGQLSGDSVIFFNPDGFQGGRGVVVGAHPRVVADYTVGSSQAVSGTTDARLENDHVMAGAAGNVDGGNLTVGGNTQSALAQANSASNALQLSATSTTTSAAVFGAQVVDDPFSDASADITTDTAFAVTIGGALGTSTATPVTVSANTLVAQAGMNSASNALGVDATSAINGTGVPVSYASTGDDTQPDIGEGAVADFALFSLQTTDSGASASISPGLVGVEVVGGGIGTNAATSALTVSDNRLAAQASSNDATNAVSLNGASSISATTALNNEQYSHNDIGTTNISATASDAQVGIHDDTGADINTASLVVSGNSLGATASANSASNAISVTPVALNAGSAEATLSTSDTGTGIDLAVASNSLQNAQYNSDLVNATVSDSSIGVDPAAGAASPLLNSAATVGGNSAMASASGNSAASSIMLASLSSGVASSALVSNQLNLGDVTATVSNTQIGVTAGGASTSPVTVGGNTISATAVGNSASNHIGIAH